MNILSFFTDGGFPKEGLEPIIKVIDVSTGNPLVSWETMTEISDGWYKYNFMAYDYTKEYVVVCDGGSALSDSERFNEAAKDNSNLDNSKVVWDDSPIYHQIPGTFGKIVQENSDNLKRALGLIHENIYIDEPVYDENNNLVSARVRIYSDPYSVGTSNDVIGTYLINSTGDGAGKFTNWSQIRYE